MVSGRPARPGSSDHGVPASQPDGVSTSRRSPIAGSTGPSSTSPTCRKLSSRDPRMAAANGPARSEAAMSRSAATASS